MVGTQWRPLSYYLSYKAWHGMIMECAMSNAIRNFFYNTVIERLKGTFCGFLVSQLSSNAVDSAATYSKKERWSLSQRLIERLDACDSLP